MENGKEILNLSDFSTHRAYDDLDRLTEEVSRSSTTSVLSYAFDLVGNRTQIVDDGVTNAYALGTGNRLASWGTNGESTVSYDTAGCVTNMIHEGITKTFSWNSGYELTSVSTNGIEAESYTYDALGRRVRVVSGGVTNYLVYDGIHVIAEVDVSGDLQKSYTWGPGIDNLLAFTTGSGTATTNTYYALTDHLGTVHALADESGAIVESYRFDAFGRVLGVYDGGGTPLTESAVGNHYLHQGRWYSWKTGLYFHRARWYDPITGRFLSKDPIGISGGLNTYVFANNNGVNFVDPFGLDAYIILRGYRGTAFDPNIGHVVVAVDMPDGSVLTRDAAKPAGDGVGMLFKGGDLRDPVTYAGGIAETLKNEGATGLITFPSKKAGFLGRSTSDDILREALQEGRKGFGGGFGLYCSTYAARMLGKAGYGILEGYTPNALFESARQYADSFNLTVDYFEDDKCKK